MFNKSIFKRVDVRLVLLAIVVVLFILGAGAPGCPGGLVG